MQQSYVTDATGTAEDAEQSMRQAIHVCSEALKIPVEETANGTWSIPKTARKADPWNEFEQGDQCLSAAFPTTFLFGKAYGRKGGGLTYKQRRHLLLQHGANAAENSELLFYMFDQLQRHEVLSRVAAKVNGNKRAFMAFGELARSTEFKEKVKVACKEVKSAEAREVLAKLMPIMTICAPSKSQFGLSVSKQTDVKIRNMCRRYGPASVFLTIAPDDINNPTSFQ